MIKMCKWKNIEHEVSGWDYWETECGEGFCLADGTPQTYNMCFCPFCGLRIEQLSEGVKSERNDSREATCAWKYVEGQAQSRGYWETECKESIHLTSGTPREIGLHFCPFCSHRIKQMGREEPENE